MKPGIYVVENIDKRTVLLNSLDEENEQYTFQRNKFTHQVSPGDMVRVWLEGTQWKTKQAKDIKKN